MVIVGYSDGGLSIAGALEVRLAWVRVGQVYAVKFLPPLHRSYPRGWLSVNSLEARYLGMSPFTIFPAEVGLAEGG